MINIISPQKPVIGIVCILITLSADSKYTIVGMRFVCRLSQDMFFKKIYGNRESKHTHHYCYA